MGENSIALPDRWKKARLSEERLFSFENGLWTGKKPPFVECPVVRNTNFTDEGHLDLSNVATISIEARQLERKRLRWGDIVIERSGGGPQQPVGRVAFFGLHDGNYCFSNFTSRLRVVDLSSVDPLYLHLYLFYFHFSGKTENLQRRTTGIRNLDFTEYKNSEIPVPPLSEQRAIAHTLRAVQQAKDARQRELTLERERKAALMEHLFTHGTRGEPRKQTEIGTMPESWRVVKIEEVAVALGSGVTPRGGEKTYLQDGIPLIRSQNVQMNRLSLDDVAFISPETHQAMMRSAVQPGDVLLNITGASIGRVACVPESVNIANVNQHVCRMRISNNATPEFVSYYLSSPKGQSQIMGAQFGTTRQGLNYANVRAVKLPYPANSEQRAIASALCACDAKIDALKREALVLDELFRAILDELMTGQLSAVSLVDHLG